MFLVYERSKVLERHLQVKFGYEEIIRVINITEAEETMFLEYTRDGHNNILHYQRSH